MMLSRVVQTRLSQTLPQPTGRKEEKSFETPLDELSQRLDRLEALIEQTKTSYIESRQPPLSPTNNSTRSSIVNSTLKTLKKLRKKSSEIDDEEVSTPSASMPSKTSGTNPSTPRSQSRYKQPEAKFIPMQRRDEAEVVEIIRRIAELVVVGERAAAMELERKEKLDKVAEKQKWGDEIIAEDDDLFHINQHPSSDTDKYLALFDHFFERNGLSLITDIVIGAAFNLSSPNEEATTASDRSPSVDQQLTEKVLKVVSDEDDNCLLLPPLPVAVQAVQSVSILVQNVSRATSLYFILSNNHVNQLIDFPLEHYHVADRKLHNQDTSALSPRRSSSQELAELTTHFVSFLKSLALRMNVETLQFFLKYPGDDSEAGTQARSPYEAAGNKGYVNPPEEDRPLDEIEPNANAQPEVVDRPVPVEEVKVLFPLYARALEFCSAHQDSFVRLTAMNICLNTLRLTTVRSDDEKDMTTEERTQFATASSPDGVLHNAKPLPLRERLAIAQHVCAPSRVERLISPIFTKLAQFWGMLEECFRENDSPTAPGPSNEGNNGKTGNAKVAKAKEAARQQKMTKYFNSIADSIQDEFLLLEDVLKVGLTSLNEQAIEMLLATFVYPLLLQPLLLYFQRSPVPDNILFADPLNDHTAGRPIKYSDLTCGEKSLISAPAKSAFFSIVAVFKFITNQPMLRLIFAALFHPLSPNTTGETMIRAKADVACIGANGKMTLRIDPVDSNGRIDLPSDRSTYLFGTVTGHKYHSADTEDIIDDHDSCVFVLAPALAEVLEFKGDDVGLVARTRHNPYRKAIFKCFTLSNELSDLRPLAALAVDSAVSVFNEQFVADIMLGLDVKKFADNMPVDERTSDSKWAHLLDDRGMGGPALLDSRRSIGEPSGGKVGFDHMNEVLSSFRSCLIYAIPGGNGKPRFFLQFLCFCFLVNLIYACPRRMEIGIRCECCACFFMHRSRECESYAGRG